MKPVHEITYLSAPAEVSMADQWFDIATVEHFWIRRRFDVLRSLAGDIISGARNLAEIGCGNGLLQRQIEDAYGKEVSGFDLNETALKKNISRLGTVNCYDIFQKEPSLRERFDVIFLFDVLEHITDEKKFLEAIVFHLAPAGHLIVNVPACQWAYSEYDRAVGHVRRYSIRSLGDSGALANLRVTKCTYWGLPLVPAMVLRKLYLTGKTDQDEITSSGFAVANKSVNRLMGLLSDCEFIPQKLIGTSVTAVFGR